MAANDPKDPLSRYFEAAMGLTELTRKRAEKLVRSLAEQGGSAGNPRELVENLLERSQENREAMLTVVRSETKRILNQMGLATSNDVERLEQQLRAVRRELREQREAAEADETQQTADEATEKATKKAAKKRAKKATERATEEAGEGSGGSPAKKAAKRTARKKTGS